MASPLVTFDSVAAAAEQLQTSSQRVSVRSVIAVLGGGSPNDVLPHLRAWKAGRPVVQAADLTLDPRIAALVAEQITSAVADATKTAEQRAADALDDAEAVAEAGRAAEKAATELAAKLTDAEADNQQLVGQIDQLTRDVEQIRAEAGSQVKEAKDIAERERQAAETARQALARAELRLEAVPPLEKQVEALRAQLDAERIARTEAEKAAAVATAERDQHSAALVRSEQREVELRRELAELQVKHDVRGDKVLQQAEAIAVLTTERDAARTDLFKTTAALEKLSSAQQPGEGA